MKLIEKKMNLFDADDKYYFAHCISSDAALGAGIAKEFQKRFRLRDKIIAKIKEYPLGYYPKCILIGKVFNLVTKKYYYNKPTYNSLKLSLQEMNIYCISKSIKYLAIPKLGCGLDKLQWGKVREIIQEVFVDTDIEILVCYL